MCRFSKTNKSEDQRLWNCSSHSVIKHQDLISISDKTSYFKILQSLEAERFLFRVVWSLCNLTGTSAGCLKHFKAIWQLKLPISQLRGFTRSSDKTSYRILKRGSQICSQVEHCSCCTCLNFTQLRIIHIRFIWRHNNSGRKEIRSCCNGIMPCTTSCTPLNMNRIW